MKLVIPFPRQVHQRTGRFRHTHLCQAGQLQPSGVVSATYALLFYWKQLEWLTLQVSTSPNPGVDFLDTHRGLQEVCKSHRTTLKETLPKEVLSADGATINQQHAFQVQSINRSQALSLEFVIDTDNDKFRKAYLDRATEDQQVHCLVLTFNVVAFDRPGDRLQSESGRVQLLIEPATPVAVYDGWVALDLGNTASTMVCLPAGREHSNDLLSLSTEGERGRLQMSGPETMSDVRIDDVLTFDAEAIRRDGIRLYPSVENDQKARTIRWVIGSRASALVKRSSGGPMDGLVLGAKRLMAGKNSEGASKIIAEHYRYHTQTPTRMREQIEILNRLPAELLTCSLLQQFAGATREGEQGLTGWPRYLAVTYPTTFTPTELDRLCRTVYRAWLRAFKPVALKPDPKGMLPEDPEPVLRQFADLVERQLLISGNEQGSSKDSDPPLISLRLDEASASAFFFLYKKIFESPGGLAAFNYQYPDGLNLLLYDCGGGTTDIALVRAYTDPDNRNRLHLKVPGRTGLRHFAGDDVTRALCRLLKAKLARTLVSERQPAAPLASVPQSPPREATLEQQLHKRAEVERFLKEMQPHYHLVPTRFDPHDISDAAMQARERVSTLWLWAEQLKRKLENAHKATLGDLDVRLGRDQSKLANALLEHRFNDPSRLQTLTGLLGAIEIHRWEINALIGRQVLRSINNCNYLISSCLASGAEEGEQMVHLVVASGNGSRYPFIQEMLRSRLNVPGLEQPETLEVDPSNLKHAVAKGAALALACLRNRRGWKLDFDTHLSEYLCYDVGLWEPKINTGWTLFKHHQPYDQLGEQTVPQDRLAGAGQDSSEPSSTLRDFTLWRRFPGDGDGLEPEDELYQTLGWSQYLIFHFPKGIQGDLTVSYDPDPRVRNFCVRDSSDQRGEPREFGDDKVFLSPIQRGDL